MGLIENESIPRRKMILFFLIDTSASMTGSKIGSVNDAIENVLPMVGDISDENPDAEINVAALEFSTGTRWLYALFATRKRSLKILLCPSVFVVTNPLHCQVL